MTSLRAFLLAHRHFAAMLLALTLFLKALVPAGFMPQWGARTIAIQICADASGEQLSRVLVIPQRHAPRGDHHDGASGLCPFAGLTHAGLAGADPLLLAEALAFAMLVGLMCPPALPLRRVPYLRPPLRGPPVRA